ncbi:TniQ family protein [Pseudoruegeria sp. SK021]|uniref:TniQ family protein n=1 Tax=Pseudoruegeria sp. SK021 TaxID=1933035 RepID=UPI000A238F2B|nr:hypothetical protein BV911_13050 [Pseudoruegeria sp. SK021]
MTLTVLPFHDDELFTGYVSRCARALSLTSVVDFLADLRALQADFQSGQPEAISRVAKALGVDPARAKWQTFSRDDGQNVRLAGVVLHDKRLLRSQFRVCPACLRADIGTVLSPKSALNAYPRMAWSIRPVVQCPQHNLLLVHPLEASQPHEFSQSWEAWLQDIVDGDMDVLVPGGAGYEAHVSDVFSGNPSSLGWADGFPLDALGLIAETLGVAKLFGAGRRLADCGVCQTSCPPISCGVSDFRGAEFVFWIQPDRSGRLPVSGFS